MAISGRWLSTAFLVGCASAGPTDRPVHPAPDDPPEPPLTPDQIVDQLESHGFIPTLDRTDALNDADSDGIRDDIERYIETHYPQLSDPARQLAKALQSSLVVDLGDAEAIGGVAVQIARAVDCVDRSGVNIENMPNEPDVIDDLQAITANTKERMLRYLAFNAALDGTLSFPLEGDVCD